MYAAESGREAEEEKDRRTTSGRAALWHATRLRNNAAGNMAKAHQERAIITGMKGEGSKKIKDS
jgi:hypothetical protein